MIKQTTYLHFGFGSIATRCAVDTDGNGVMFCHETEPHPICTEIPDTEWVNPDEQDVIIVFHNIEGLTNIIDKLTITRDIMMKHKEMNDALEKAVDNLRNRGIINDQT